MMKVNVTGIYVCACLCLSVSVSERVRVVSGVCTCRVVGECMSVRLIGQHPRHAHVRSAHVGRCVSVCACVRVTLTWHGKLYVCGSDFSSASSSQLVKTTLDLLVDEQK